MINTYSTCKVEAMFQYEVSSFKRLSLKPFYIHFHKKIIYRFVFEIGVQRNIFSLIFVTDIFAYNGDFVFPWCKCGF